MSLKETCHGRETEFAIGAKASSSMVCAEVSRIIVDPATDTVTHLVASASPSTGGKLARLVPVDLVDAAAGDIRLRCTLAEFGKLDETAEELAPVENVLGGLGISATPMAPMSIPATVTTVV